MTAVEVRDALRAEGFDVVNVWANGEAFDAEFYDETEAEALIDALPENGLILEHLILRNSWVVRGVSA